MTDRGFLHRLLATFLAIGTVLMAASAEAAPLSIAGVPAAELREWQESFRRAGATSKEAKEFEAFLSRQTPLQPWIEFIRASSPGFFENWIKSRRVSAREGARQRSPRPIYEDTAPVRSCESLRELSFRNTTIESAAIDPNDKACHVAASIKHSPANDRVRVFVALPVSGWNGRFQGTGGAGGLGGSAENLKLPLEKGYAAAWTNAGHDGASYSWVLDANGRFDWQNIRNWAYLGIHEMTVLGKAVIEAFYGKPARYAYFAGGSAGGRQGLTEAERYPEDYDGILLGCPSINVERTALAGLWPQVVMLEAKNVVSKAKLEAATTGAVRVCDAADGVVDGVIDNPSRCAYDPKLLVGSRIQGTEFTAVDAEVIRKIWEGPRSHDGEFLWHGMARGAYLGAVAAGDGSPLRGKPNGLPIDWIRYFLLREPQWEWETLVPGQYELLFDQSVEQYRSLVGADNPDLTKFRDRGGKLIIYHGLADQLLPAQGSVDYYQRVQERMGGPEGTKEFARLFLVPGVDHSFVGAGPSPTGMMNAIVDWVEAGKAPDRLLAESNDHSGKVLRTRPLFPYPQVAKYRGKGSTDSADNFDSVAE